MDWYWYLILYVIGGLVTTGYWVYTDSKDKGKLDDIADYVLAAVMWLPFLFAWVIIQPFGYLSRKGKAKYLKSQQDAKALEQFRKEQAEEEKRLFKIAGIDEP